MSSRMIEHAASRPSFASLVICLCLGGLIALFVGGAFGLSGMEVSGVDFGNYHWLDQAEFDDEFFVVNDGDVKEAELFFPGAGRMKTGCQSASLSPISPLPKARNE